ncbi:hypothetical protein D3C75_800540 [compost metagenome]
MVNDIFTKELGEDVFLNGNEFICLAEQLRLLLAQPHQLGDGGHRMDRCSCTQVDLMAAQFIPQTGGTGSAAVIRPGYTGGQGLA